MAVLATSRQIVSLYLHLCFQFLRFPADNTGPIGQGSGRASRRVCFMLPSLHTSAHRESSIAFWHKLLRVLSACAVWYRPRGPFW